MTKRKKYIENERKTELIYNRVNINSFYNRKEKN